MQTEFYFIAQCLPFAKNLLLTSKEPVQSVAGIISQKDTTPAVMRFKPRLGIYTAVFSEEDCTHLCKSSHSPRSDTPTLFSPVRATNLPSDWHQSCRREAYGDSDSFRVRRANFRNYTAALFRIPDLTRPGKKNLRSCILNVTATIASRWIKKQATISESPWAIYYAGDAFLLWVPLALTVTPHTRAHPESTSYNLKQRDL